jgi:hypothetical protein
MCQIAGSGPQPDTFFIHRLGRSWDDSDPIAIDCFGNLTLDKVLSLSFQDKGLYSSGLSRQR